MGRFIATMTIAHPFPTCPAPPPRWGVCPKTHTRYLHYDALPIPFFRSLLPLLSFSGARNRPLEYGDSSPFSSAPRSAQTVQGPPPLPAHLRRSTLRVDSVGRVHNSEIETHGCGHKSPSQSRRDVPKQAQGGADARNERGATLGYEDNAKQKPEGLALTL